MMHQVVSSPGGGVHSDTVLTRVMSVWSSAALPIGVSSRSSLPTVLHALSGMV